MILLVLGVLDVLAAFIGLLGHFGFISSSVVIMASCILFVKFLLFPGSFSSKVDLGIGFYFLGIAFFGFQTFLIFFFFFFLVQKGFVAIFS